MSQPDQTPDTPQPPPDLAEAEAAWQAGDYRRARRLLDRIQQAELAPQTRQQVEDLERKLRPEPFGTALALLSFLLFCVLVALVLTR